MNGILDKSRLVKEEADFLLHKYNLVKILQQYGNVRFTGSYELDLMLKKDIDISLVNDNLSVEKFTELGKELIDKLETPSVYYRNTRITPVENRPENSLYWGIKTGDWFFDIWAMSNKVYQRAEKYIDRIKSKINDRNKKTILSLKNEFIDNNTYGKLFSSRELYDAVLNFDVTTSDQFYSYLENKKDLNFYL